MKKKIGESKMKLIGILLTSFLLVIAIGCTDIPGSNETKLEAQNKLEEHTKVIKLSDDVMTEFGLEVKLAKTGFINNHINLTGEINVQPSKISHIVPRFSGIVQHVYKTVGEQVKKGELLALIESNESLTNYEVKSLIEGTIIEMHMTQGELIGSESQAFTIANLNNVWAMLSIYQKDIDKIKMGQNVLISLGSIDSEITGNISYISPIVDEATRTASARVVINNSSGKWRPGMFVTAKGMFIQSEITTAITDLKKELNLYIDTIFKLMEVKS